ncbi:hypothetical protein [Candidatus Halobonum tyrrellensis]|uniref:DUF8048 domain-containing protein n=1 Tax=Candidatus Halobonum tyrrellensis G22 TaxID=1324957 RepID=V4GS30_9EURY|nr:hypothetical protein [Candidatus Halobonum tyrrellensis]ESP87871.1 hypothetical protein K933_11951 [Candidatus Halobonum tyrrellensis G22]
MSDPDSDAVPADDAPALPAPLASHVGPAARETGADAAAVGALLGRTVEHVRAYPGVADLVFEYRRAFSHDPLVDRDGDAYYLLVPPHVLPAFASALDADETGPTWAAARAAHRRAFVEATGVADHGDWDPLVLVAGSQPSSGTAGSAPDSDSDSASDSGSDSGGSAGPG